ncbi:MAG: uracil-DNA glycosylase [Acidobacteria bacterium]|nr:uracil-DNA glycosylase [Acidobacteriota bacterium]
MRSDRRWQALTGRIVACRACPRLVAWRERVAREKRRAFRDDEYWGRPVPGFGDVAARLVLVGLAPAAHGANRTGRMFTGDSSGDFLFARLHAHGFATSAAARDAADGLRLAECYITAACRCAPPDNRPSPAELAACRPFLVEELGLLRGARAYLALGAIGWDALLRALPAIGRAPGTPRPRFGHGAEVPLAGGATLLGVYHPSRQNTQTGRLTAAMFDAVLARAREILRSSDR